MSNDAAPPSITLNISGAGADAPELPDELRDALAGSVEAAPIMGLADIWRYAVEWGPDALIWLGTLKPGLETAKLALEIVDKLLKLLQHRPGLTITIPSRNGPIKVEGAKRELVQQLIAAELARGTDSTETETT
jgi:hypothetical protein